MTLKSISLAVALCLASVLPGQAVTCTAGLGDVTNGATCTDVLSTQTIDWIDFSLATDPGFAVTELSFTVQTVSGSNFHPVIGLYSGGSLIAATGNWGGTQGLPLTLSFSGIPALADGNYRLGVAGRNAFFTPDIANASSTAFFNNGTYSLGIAATISPIPLPAAALLLLTALGALGLASRTRRAA